MPVPDIAVHAKTVFSGAYQACADKVRQPGYWHHGLMGATWIADTSSQDCRYDLSHSDAACIAANCPRRRSA